jgi:hypothetical protein
MIRAILLVAAFVSIFLFPYPATFILSFIASLFFPPAALIAGIITDLVYFVPGAYAFPLGIVLGALLSLIAFFVRRFAKTRISLSR